MRVMPWVAAIVAFLTACSGGGTDAATGPGTAPDPNPGTASITDAALSALARAETGWTYYKNNPDTLLRSATSGHGEPRVRTRFNARVATQLDAAGKMRADADFPDSSLIAKELIVGGVLNRYAVMYKLRGSGDSGPAGWLWAYYSPSGATQIGIAGKGASCSGCHSSGIDFTRMNDSHP